MSESGLALLEKFIQEEVDTENRDVLEKQLRKITKKTLGQIFL